MGVVIPFPSKPRPAAFPSDGLERSVLEAVARGGDRVDLVRAAQPLLDRCRDRFGVVVLGEGLPHEDAVLAQSLVKLSRALHASASVVGHREPTWVLGVTFGGTELSCVDDGETLVLEIPVDADLASLSRFLADRLEAQVA